MLGPVPTSPTGLCQFQWFKDSSHTRNGHSIVLKFIYGNRRILVGSDLNRESERYLLAHYHPGNPFEADTTKACHHGSSEFDVEFLKAIQTYATIVSSGDNENYSHPHTDALGSVGRHSRGERPLVFSTELARSFRSADDVGPDVGETKRLTFVGCLCSLTFGEKELKEIQMKEGRTMKLSDRQKQAIEKFKGYRF